MEESFLINMDHLRADQVCLIGECLSPRFMGIEERDLTFPNPIEVSGKAYLASDHLVIQLRLETMARIPCSLCNESLDYPIRIDPFYHSEPLAELPRHTFNLLPQLREAILLEVPQFSECHDANCPNRHALKDYMQKAKKPATASAEYYFPFAELEKESSKLEKEPFKSE